MVKKVNTINTTAFVKKPVYDNKMTKIEGELTSITSLTTTAALSAVGNKIPNVIDLVKKTKYDAKVSGIENKYFTPSCCDNFMGDILDAKIKEEE